MKVRLKVLNGGSKGKELKLKEGEFLIGRSDSCHLRPKSDAISRKHCVLFVDQKQVRVRDLKSRNGTLVNGEKIDAETELKMGDLLSVGPLQFELVISHDQPVPAAKAPLAAAPPTPAKAAGSAARGRNVVDDDISSWLEEADEVDREERLSDPGTRRFKIEAGKNKGESAEEMAGVENGGDTDAEKPKKKEKKEPGKLPTAPAKVTENSQQAAADALKQFFKRS